MNISKLIVDRLGSFILDLLTFVVSHCFNVWLDYQCFFFFFLYVYIYVQHVDSYAYMYVHMVWRACMHACVVCLF